MINPDETTPFEAYCDMTQDGGGWTVFQRRVDASVNFYLGWSDYKAGFGDLSGNLWAGLDHLHAMTALYGVEMHVYMDTFEGDSAYAWYDTFAVGDSASGYVLSISGYTGNAGDSLAKHNSQQFSTPDNDQDAANSNCAVAHKGAWWYEACHSSNLNGQYLSGSHASFADGVNWKLFKTHYYSLRTTIMKVRRK